MQVENSFPVKAPPDRVYKFLLDVNSVAGCVPGAELSEVVDPDTFRGKVRIKVGPVTVRYNGTARITARDPDARSATLEAEGRETTGSGSAQATTTMSVAADGEDSTVTLATDFTVVGRIAQFGLGIMEDVSRHLVAEMAECIRATLEAPEGGAAGAGDGGEEAAAAGDGGSLGTAPVADSMAGPVDKPVPPVAPPLDALALGRSIAAERFRRLSPRRALSLAAGALLAVLAWRRRARRRRGSG